MDEQIEKQVNEHENRQTDIQMRGGNEFREPCSKTGAQYMNQALFMKQ